MQVVILAGGLGTRLGDLARALPKSLIPVAGKPFILHQIDLLKRNGITDLVLCVGHFADQIKLLLGDGADFGVRVTYSFDGPILLGTGGAIRKALPMLGEVFLVLYGDSYLDIDYQQVYAAFIRQRKQGLMTVLRNQGQWDESNVLLVDGRVVKYRKSSPAAGMEHIDYGLAVLHRNVFEALPTERKIDLANIYENLVSQDELASFEVHQRFYEIGSRRGLAETEQYLLQPGVHH